MRGNSARWSYCGLVSGIVACRGQAMTEFLISMAFFVPVFITVPLLGKYIDLKQNTISANRYAVWERTVWSDARAGWNDGENHKSDNSIGREIQWRFFGHPLQSVGASGATMNTLWRDYKQRALLRTVNGNAIGERASPVPKPGVDNVAYSGIPVLGGLASAASSVTSKLGSAIPGCAGLPGIDFSHGLNLGGRTYAVATVTATMSDFTVSGGILDIQAKGAILSDAWAAPSDESALRKRIGNLVPEEIVGCTAVAGAKTFGLLSMGSYSFLFGEGLDADHIDTVASSNVLLPEYRK